MNSLILSLHFYEIFPKLVNFQRRYSQNTGHLYNESKQGKQCLFALFGTKHFFMLKTSLLLLNFCLCVYTNFQRKGLLVKGAGNVTIIFLDKCF